MTTALVMGTIIGSGIFLLPASLAPLGVNALWAWVVSGIGIGAIAYGMARLSRLGGGGIQANVEARFGPTTGFAVAWSFWVSNWTVQAAVAIAAMSALRFAFPSAVPPSATVPGAIFWLLALTGLNMLGARAAGGFSVVTTAIKLLPLLAVIALFAERSALGPPLEPIAATPLTLANLAAATALTFFALTGFECACTPVGKVRDAERTLPRSLIAGVLAVALLYLAAGTAIQRLLPAEVIAGSSAPFADALVARFGSGAALLAALGIAVAAVGCLNGLILSTGELGYSMALRGDLPAAMRKTNGAGTPLVAQVAGTLLSIAVLLLSQASAAAALYAFVALLGTAAVAIVYLVGVAGAWGMTHGPGRRAILLLAFAFIAFAAYGMGWQANLYGVVLLGIGLGVRALMHRSNRAGAMAIAPPAPAA
jgi:APA family basic amino acid/polyamine antiporter